MANQYMHLNHCANCGHEFSGNFCNHCGQKTIHRYTIKHVLHEFTHVITHADKGIFSFAWNIIKKPGAIALDLVEGRRKKYFNLFQYLILITGFVTFLMVKTDYMQHMMKNTGSFSNTEVSNRVAAMQQKTGSILQQYNNILQLALIPVYALFSWLFIGRPKKYNYAENVVLHSAGSAQINTLSLFTLALTFISSSFSQLLLAGILSVCIMIFSFSLCYYKFYKLSALHSFLYAVLVFIISYVVQIILITIVMFAYLFISK